MKPLLPQHEHDSILASLAALHKQMLEYQYMRGEQTHDDGRVCKRTIETTRADK